MSVIHRRRFLRDLGAGLMAASLPLTGQEPKKLIKMGFLGTNHSHAPDKWKVVSESGDFELVGFAEDSSSGPSFAAPGARRLSPASLLSQVEVVAVESAVLDHARHARLALQAGKHVHVEKPPAATFAEFQELATLAAEKKLLLQVGYQWRYHPGFEKIFEAVNKGWVGEIFLVRGLINTLVTPERRPEWAEFSGGGMFELGSHLIDQIVRLLGKPEQVHPFLQTHESPADDLRDNNLAVFRYPRTMAVLVNSTRQANAFPYRSFEVFGTAGSAILKPIEPAALELDFVKASGPYSPGRQVVTLPAYRRYTDDFRNLAEAVRGEKPLKVPLTEELLVQEWLLRVCGM